jgi:hypothetical protein
MNWRRLDGKRKNAGKNFEGNPFEGIILREKL